MALSASCSEPRMEALVKGIYSEFVGAAKVDRESAEPGEGWPGAYCGPRLSPWNLVPWARHPTNNCRLGYRSSGRDKDQDGEFSAASCADRPTGRSCSTF